MSSSTLFTRKYKNTNNTNDWWILDSEQSLTNPVVVYTDIDNKHDATYVINLYNRETRAEKKRAKEESSEENILTEFFGK